jgi:predicted dehydrogenase
MPGLERGRKRSFRLAPGALLDRSDAYRTCNPDARIGVIGLGTQGGKLAAALSRMRCRIAALCDLDRRRAEAFKAFAPDVVATDRIADLSGLDLDVAIVATLADSHLSLIDQLARMGIRRILCEKPIVGMVGELASLRNRVEREGLCVVANHKGLWMPENVRIRELIKNEALGRLTSAEAHFKPKGFGNIGCHAIARVLYLTDRKVRSAESAFLDESQAFSRTPRHCDPNGWALYELSGGVPLFACNLTSHPRRAHRIVFNFERGRIEILESRNTYLVADFDRGCENETSLEHAWRGTRMSPDTMCYLLDESLSDLLAGDSDKLRFACDAVEAIIAAQLSYVRNERVALSLGDVSTPFRFS